MDAVLLVALVLLCVVIGQALSGYREDPLVLPNLFRYQGPGWPHGVQEDDDAHFDWHRPARPAEPDVERVHGRVRPAARGSRAAGRH